MFRGRYQHTIDPKGRLSIPAKFRDVLARYEGADLVVVPDGECLEVYPVAEWERMESKLREQSRFSAEVREISRLYVSRARDVALDGAGRILLSPDIRREAALDKNVTIVGGSTSSRCGIAAASRSTTGPVSRSCRRCTTSSRAWESSGSRSRPRGRGRVSAAAA